MKNEEDRISSGTIDDVKKCIGELSEVGDIAKIVNIAMQKKRYGKVDKLGKPEAELCQLGQDGDFS